MDDIIEEPLLDCAMLGGRDTTGRIRALVPFSARKAHEEAQIFNPASFTEVDYKSTVGLRWAATTLVVRNDHGSHKLYMCQRKDLAMWVPCGDWFYSNQSPPATKSIADYVQERFRPTNRSSTDQTSVGGGEPDAYQCLRTLDPLPDLIKRTNKYLLDLRLIKWITQKRYEQLCINQTDVVELAHLYYLPKAHKLGTPLRPIISGLKHPTLKISKFLDDLLRPLFDKMASSTTIVSGFELIKHLQKWSITNMRQETILCTIDIVDLYTMIPQIEGVLALKKMLDYLQLKQIGGIKTETIIRLARFVIQNNYFSYNGQYYQQIRGGAMGSPLTLTIANCYMFFFEQAIIRQIHNSNGLYFRYIDDIFIIINWPIRHLLKQVERWNKFDINIKLSANISLSADFLDLHIENKDNQLYTTIYQKPSYEPYYLPFHSIHPIHMKKNIPFAMLLRAIRYCSTFQGYLDEREKLRMSLLLNKYPNEFIDKQFNCLLAKFNINEPLTYHNYTTIRQTVINNPTEIKQLIDYGRTMFVHFTYCSSMKTFPVKFHNLWKKYFDESPINTITPILGTRNVDNLQRRLVQTRHS